MNRWFLDPLLRGSYPADMVDHYERRFGASAARRAGRHLAADRLPRRQLLLAAARPVRPRAAAARARPGEPGRADDGDGLGGRPRRPVRAARAAPGRLRRRADLHHRERRRVRRPAGGQRDAGGPAAGRVPARPPGGAVAGGRRRRRRAALLRLVDARQLRVGARLHEAVRPRLRGLLDAAPRAQAQRPLVPRLHRRAPVASIAFSEVSKVFPDGTAAVDGLDLAVADGELRRARRSVRLRQVDGAADGGRARGGDGGDDPDRRPRGQRRRAQGPRHRDGVPELRAVPAHERGGQPRLRPEDARRAVLVARRRGLPAARDRRPARAAAAAAERRPAPAGRAWGARSCASRRRS